MEYFCLSLTYCEDPYIYIHNIFEFFPSNCIFWQLKLYIHLENDTGGAIWGKTNDLSQIVTLKIYWWSMEKGHWCISFYKCFLVYYILVLLSSPYIPFFPLSVHHISLKRMLSFDIFSETKEEQRRYRWFKMIFVPHNDYFLCICVWK